jgi:carbamoyl-phosphate synthase large subunit
MANETPIRRVLLTSGGTGVGNATLTALRRSTIDYWAVTTNTEPFHSGVFRSDACHLTPRSDEDPDGWAELILKVVADEAVRLVIPCRDSDVLVLARLRGQVEARGAVVACPDERIATACLDKVATDAFLRELGLATPATAAADDLKAVDAIVGKHGFPVIVKPRRGTGTVGVVLVNSEAKLTSFLAAVHQRAHEWVVQEYLPIEAPLHSVTQYTALAQDREYSIQLLFNANGHVAIWMASVNTLENGLPVAMRFDRSAAVVAAVARIKQPLDGMIGPLNLQARLSGDELAFFEANARCTGLTGSRTFFGLNEVDALWELLVERREIGSVCFTTDICIYRNLEDTAFALEDLQALKEVGWWRRLPQNLRGEK